MQYCVHQAWSLPVDMQLSVLGTVLLWGLPLRLGRGLVAVTLLSLVPPFLATLMTGGPPMVVWSPQAIRNPRLEPWVFTYYLPTHMRATPHLVGMSTAAFMLHLKVRLKISTTGWKQREMSWFKAGYT